MRPVRLAWWIWGLVIAGAMLLGAWVQPARAQEVRGLIFDCAAVAQGISAAAVYRDVGADLGKTIAYYRENAPSVPEARKAVVEREIRRMWREGLPAAEAAFSVYKRCQKQLGDMGRET